MTFQLDLIRKPKARPEKKKAFYFLEVVPDTLDPNFEIVSLRPEVSYELKKRKLPYFILEDFYEEKSLFADEEPFFYRQLNWYNQFDELIRKQIPFAQKHSIDFVRSYYLRFKYLVDYLLLKSKMVQSFIERSEPKSIHFIGFKFDSSTEKTIFDHTIEERKSYFYVLKGLSDKFKFSFEQIPQLSKKALTFNKIKTSVVRKWMKSFYRAFSYEKYRRWFQVKKALQPNVLFLDAGTVAVDLIIKQAMKRGSAVYFENPDLEIEILSKFFEAKINEPLLNSDSEIEETKRKAVELSEQLDRANIYSFYDQECGFSTRDYFSPFFKHFLAEVIPQTIMGIKRHFSLYQSKQIGIVYSRESTTQKAVSALLAAKITGIPSVCLQHGFSLNDYKAFHRTELDLFDYSVVQDPEAKTHFQNVNESKISHPCKVILSPNYFRHLKNSGRPHLNHPKRIFYLSAKLGNGVRCFNDTNLPMTWYYEFLVKMISFFQHRTDLDFTLKIAPEKWTQTGVIPLVNTQNFRHMRIESKPFIHYLSQIDRVIIDFPSTGAYEAALAGIPTLILCNDSYPIRKSAVNFFGNCVKFYHTDQEALKHVESFLASDPKAYIFDFPIVNESPDIIEEIMTVEKWNHSDHLQLDGILAEK